MHGHALKLTRLPRTLEALLILAMAPAVAIGQPTRMRTITRAELPAVVRDSLASQGAVHLKGSQVTRVRDVGTTLTVTPNEVLAVRTASRSVYVPPKPASGDSTGVPASAAARAHYVLPTTYLTTDTGATKTLALVAVLYPSNALRYQDGHFRGSFLIGVADSTNPSASLNLAQAIKFQFAGENEDVNPGGVEIHHTNLPFESVEVTATDPGDSVRIHVIPQLDPAGADVWLMVSPQLAFVGPPTRVEGFGLENATVVLRAIGTRHPVQVTLAPSVGSIDSISLTIGASGTAIAHLRSRGSGPAVLTAVAPGFDSISAVVDFVFPWMFVLAALAGGAAGGAIKWLQASAPGRGVLLRAAARGAVLGAAVAIVYFVVRVNLLPFALDVQYLNEAAVFSLALLGGLFGIKAAAA